MISNNRSKQISRSWAKCLRPISCKRSVHLCPLVCSKCKKLTFFFLNLSQNGEVIRAVDYDHIDIISLLQSEHIQIMLDMLYNHFVVAEIHGTTSVSIFHVSQCQHQVSNVHAFSRTIHSFIHCSLRICFSSKWCRNGRSPYSWRSFRWPARMPSKKFSNRTIPSTTLKVYSLHKTHLTKMIEGRQKEENCDQQSSTRVNNDLFIDIHYYYVRLNRRKMQ